MSWLENNVSQQKMVCRMRPFSIIPIHYCPANMDIPYPYSFRERSCEAFISERFPGIFVAVTFRY